jgi:membrane protein implicated in regulation of membrane protease activity
MAYSGTHREARVMIVLCLLIGAAGMLAAWGTGLPWWMALFSTFVVSVFLYSNIRRYLGALRKNS